MAGREVAICLGVGLPLAGVCALKPVHEGGSILGADCGPAITAVVVRGEGFGGNDVAQACHQAAAPWVLLAFFLGGLACLLALILGIAIKRRPPRVVYVPYYPPPPS